MLRTPKDVNLPSQVTLIGCGGTGFWFAYGYVLATRTIMPKVELVLFDGDTVDITNYNRIPYESLHWIEGSNKAEALKSILEKLSLPTSQLEITAYPRDFLIKDSDKIKGILVDATDRARVQEMLKEICRTVNIPYLRLGAELHHITVDSDTTESVISGDADGYQEPLRIWIPTVMVSAALGLLKIGLAKPGSISLDLTELFKEE